MAYDVATEKKKKILIRATIWKNLANVMPSKRSQSQRLHLVGFHLYDMPREENGTETSRLEVA